MALVNSKKMLLQALQNGYAVPAFNFTNLEQLDAILTECNQKDYPAIVQTSNRAIEYMGISTVVAMVKEKCKNLKIDVCLNLDHGKDFEICKLAVDSGYTNVMIDASDKSFEQNVELTKRVVDYAHKHNVTVEAELGSLKGVEDDLSSAKSHFTDPNSALQFVKLTGVDSLAVSIGTSHGAYKFKGESKLDLKRLKEIENLLKIPLVLHGASSVLPSQLKKLNEFGGNLSGAKGVSEKQIKKAVKLGICKVNMDTDLRIAFTIGVRKSLKNPSIFDLRDYLGEGKEEMKKIISHKIGILKK